MVGRTTWNKLYEVYNDIANKLLSSSLRPGEYPGVLRRVFRHSGAGAAVLPLPHERLRAASRPLASTDSSVLPTEAAVLTYQRFAGLTVDGIVGRTTWDSLYDKASTLRASGPVVTLETPALPRYPAHSGVFRQRSALLQPALQHRLLLYQCGEPTLSDQYTDETAAATRSAQGAAGPAETGIADTDT